MALQIIDRTMPACMGLWDLFDRTDREGHARARDICSACGIFAECNAALVVELTSTKRAPQGTWAGRLIGKKGRPLKERPIQSAS